MKTKPSECHCCNDMSEFKDAWHETYEIYTETCYECETTPRVSEIYCTHGYRMDYKDHHRENEILKITKFDEENKGLFLMSLTGQQVLNLQRLMTTRMYIVTYINLIRLMKRSLK